MLMLNWGYSISGGVGDTNLNTSHVNVKFFLLFKANSAPSNLNTSHVNVK